MSIFYVKCLQREFGGLLIETLSSILVQNDLYALYRKRFITRLRFRELIHACMFLTRCGLGGGVGGARLYTIPAANVQYVCNNRNFANRIDKCLCPPLSRQPKPQSHTKWNKRKWGKGSTLKPREDVRVEKKKKKRRAKRTACKWWNWQKVEFPAKDSRGILNAFTLSNTTCT